MGAAGTLQPITDVDCGRLTYMGDSGWHGHVGQAFASGTSQSASSWPSWKKRALAQPAWRVSFISS